MAEEYMTPKQLESAMIDGAIANAAAAAPANTQTLQPRPDLPPEERFVGGFGGIAAAAFDAKAIAALSAPVDPNDVEIRPDGIVYLPGVFYRDRLNTAFGPGAWAIAPRGPIRTRSSGGGELVIYHGALWVLGRFVSEAVGQCLYYPNNRGMTFADAAEGARTDCIGRCCKDLGVARDLWDPGWRDEWKQKYSEVVDGKPRRKARPSKMTTASASAPSAASHPSATAAPAAQGAPAAAPATSAAPAADLKPSKESHGADHAEASGEIVGKVLGMFPGSTVMAGDTGEAPTDEDLGRLRDRLKAIKWGRAKTEAWAREHFGVLPNAFTAKQVDTALAMLTAVDKR